MLVLTQPKPDEEGGLDEGHPHGHVVAEVGHRRERAHHQQWKTTSKILIGGRFGDILIWRLK